MSQSKAYYSSPTYFSNNLHTPRRMLRAVKTAMCCYTLGVDETATFNPYLDRPVSGATHRICVNCVQRCIRCLARCRHLCHKAILVQTPVFRTSTALFFFKIYNSISARDIYKPLNGRPRSTTKSKPDFVLVYRLILMAIESY